MCDTLHTQIYTQSYSKSTNRIQVVQSYEKGFPTIDKGGGRRWATGGPWIPASPGPAVLSQVHWCRAKIWHAGLVCSDSTVYRTLSPVSQAPPAQARRISMGTVPEAKAHPLAEGSHGLLTTTGRATERAKTRSGIRNSGKFLLPGSLVNGSMKNI